MKKNFTDIHNHIIFEFDDGPTSPEVSQRMLLQAVEQDISVIFATSHFDEYTTPEKLHDYESRLTYLQNWIAENRLPLTLLPGAEVYYHHHLIENLSRYKHYVLGENSRFVLFEFPMFQDLPALDVIFQLKINGYFPIVAHPERYVPIIKDWRKIAEFIKLGALIQVNAGSIMGFFGDKIRQISHRLLENRLVHFIASDAHDDRNRPFLLQKTYQYCSEKYSKEWVDEIFFDNPAKLLMAKPIESDHIILERREVPWWKKILFGSKKH